MNPMPSIDSAVLRDATKQQLEQAVVQNHLELYSLSAVVKGGEVVTTGELSYTWIPEGSAIVLFPSLTAATAGEQLDTMIDYYRTHPFQHVGYYSVDPAAPADTGARLLARGFQPGWQPCWMAIDLEAIKTGYAVPEGLEIRVTNDIPVHEVKDLPYGDGGAMHDAFLQLYPGRAQRIVALLDGKVVGYNCLFFSTGPLGIAGLYNVGVVPGMQRKGIGKALVIAACQCARERGYRYAMLNANHIGRRTYEYVGFECIGYGITWWLMGRKYIVDPADQNRVKLAEAIGRGDVAALDAMDASFTTADLNTPLPIGMTLMQLAAHCRQPATAEWLVARGVSHTALDMWDLGWKDRANALLMANPQEIHRTYFDWEGNLLHIAAMRKDVELAKLALAHHVDLTLHDKEHDSIPIGWAYYFGQHGIVQLIKEYMERNNLSTGQ